ncbi:MAG TPA: penicillin acylase family protein [Vicinamibacterales bacterium]|nr:penicillin acylase family protein [Vicinamibacterales bacterium]
MRRLVLLMIALVSTAFQVQAQSPAIAIQMAGLSQPVEILRDRWGINHIYAQNENDLFFAQGYAAARDRLFQFEVWRRQATGTVAEILGRRELLRDRGARLHMYRGDLDTDLNRYHPRGKAIVEAYVRGVNAYIAETERNPSLLPLELKMLGIKPGRWTPAVVISRHQALAGNVTEEVRLLRAIKASSIDQVRELMNFQGGNPRFELDPALDLKTFPDDVLELYSAFRATVGFRPEDVAAEYRGTATKPVARHDPAPDPAGPFDLDADPRDIGSNNWVVAGSRTFSTRPILANDPHRVISAPSLRYWVHLNAPGWNVIGGGEPILPGVSIGHNEHGAWGLTIYGQDGEDLYVYDTNPANPNEYRYGGAWEPMRVITDTIPIEGEKPETVELKYTRHGPVLFEDRTNRKAYALRAGWLEPGGAPYLASLRMNQARTWEEFREACSYNNMPSENMVWVDRQGNIGWQASGIQPIRRGWSGILPVPGDGRYEWEGYLPITSLPHELNPARGYIATANNFLMPDNYPYKDLLHVTWSDAFRASRIEEVLGSGRKFSVSEMIRLQNDDLSVAARALTPLLRHVTLTNPASARARDLLTTWDFVLDKDSVAAGIYAMWNRRLMANARETIVPASLRKVGTNIVGTKKVIDFLQSPDGRFGPNPIAGRDAIVAKSMDEAVAELTKRFGPDMQAWKYGQEKFHHALVRHPMSDAVNAATRAKLIVGPLPRGGDGTTVSATGGNDNQTSGGSLKIIADTEDWDNSVGLNTPGQSGNPDDPHYRDLFQLWAQGQYFPVAYSKKKVDSVTESVTRLTPVSTSTQQR